MSERCLVFISEPERLSGLTPIQPGYPKPYSASEMRGWAGDLRRVYRLSPDELERLRRTPAQMLTPDQQRLQRADQRFLRDSSDGVKGYLREDGRVELDGGRHRAAYMLEQGIGPVPVWVSCEDPQRLRELRQSSHSGLDRQMLRLADDERDIGRERDDAAERSPRVERRDRDREAEERSGR
jgi:hypothetical protein